MRSATTSDESPELLNDQPWARNLLQVVRHFDIADKFTRDRQVRKWRKQMCYWDSLQFLWWSDVVHDWRTPEQALDDFSGTDIDIDVDPTLYAKVVNIYRAHGEIIIAAMSANTPKILFSPDDADNADDVLAAKAKTKLAGLIQRHNYTEMLLAKALFILYNQGLVCAYNETFEDESFGQVRQPIESNVMNHMRSYYCPDCGAPLGTEQLGSSPVNDDQQEQTDNMDSQGGNDSFGDESSNQDDLALDSQDQDQQEGQQQETVPPANGLGIQQGPINQAICPQCSQVGGVDVRIQPEFEDSDEIASAVTGWDVQNKCRELVTFWGPLNVKVPAWIRRPQDSPYLILETEEHYAKMQDIYPEIADLISPSYNLERFDRSMRTPIAYAGDTPRDLCTVRRCWLRSWAFNVLGDVKESTETGGDIAELKEKFPDGCYVVIINDDLVAEAVPDVIEKHWTLTQHPFSDTIHAEPLGSPMMPMQEITNEAMNLELESMEHSIAEVFADSDTLDFNEYNKSEARPGMVYPVTKRPGEAIGNSFYEVKSTGIGRDVEPFMDRIEKTSQFVVGSVPSVFGGQIEGGSNTAKEYEMSRSQALQRLSTIWKLVSVWYRQVIGKAVESYADNMLEDDNYTEDKGSGNFVNVWVRMAHAKGGKAGIAFSEDSESMPLSWNEKRSVLLQLLTMQNETVMAVLSDPENASFVARMIGIPELYIPGDEDRTKQIIEISQMAQEQPHEIPTGQIDPTTGQPATQNVSSVQIDPEIDNNVIEAEVCSIWLKSEVGMDAKENNPGWYFNVLMHCKEHKQAAMQMQMQAQQPPPGQAPPPQHANGNEVGDINSNSSGQE